MYLWRRVSSVWGARVLSSTQQPYMHNFCLSIANCLIVISVNCEFLTRHHSISNESLLGRLWFSDTWKFPFKFGSGMSGISFSINITKIWKIGTRHRLANTFHNSYILRVHHCISTLPFVSFNSTCSCSQLQIFHLLIFGCWSSTIVPNHKMNRIRRRINGWLVFPNRFFFSFSCVRLPIVSMNKRQNRCEMTQPTTMPPIDVKMNEKIQRNRPKRPRWCLLRQTTNEQN